MYFSKLLYESDKEKFCIRGVENKKICSHPNRDLLKGIWKVGNHNLYSPA